MRDTMGSAVVIAVLGPKLLGINLETACGDYEQKQGGVRNWAWHIWAALCARHKVAIEARR
jgi:hypothetical protein